MVRNFPLQLLTLTIAHWAAAVVGLQWAMIGSAGSPVWPAAGVALAGLLLGGIRLWPSILVGRFGAALTVGSTHPIWTDFLIASGNTLSAVIAVLVLKRAAKIDLSLAKVRDVLWLAAGAAVAALIASSVGTLALWMSTGFGSAQAVMVWSNWVFGSFVGAVTVAPAILAWISRGRPDYWSGKALHFAAALLTTAVVAYLMFIQDVGLRSWLLFPVLIWSAFAFHVRGAALALVIASVFAVWGATIGSGPLTDLSTPSSIMLMTQQFVAVAAFTTLVLAATAEERQRRLRRELTAVSRNLEAVLNNTQMAVFLLDEHQRCTYMNAAGEALTGYTFEETEGNSLHELVHHTRSDGSHFPADECPIHKAFPDNDRIEGEEWFVHKDGSFYPVAFTASPIRDEDSYTIGTVLEVQDISKEKAAEAALRESQERLERLNTALEERVEERTRELQHQIVQREEVQAQLRQSQKMDAIGQLTGGIAHDFNNLLTAVVGNLDLIQRTTDEARSKRLSANALKAAERGVKITSQLLAFSRSQRLEIQPIIVAPIIAEMHEMLGHTLGPSISLELELDSAEVPVMADPTQLELAVLNLAINARDAMPEGGTLTVATCPKRVSDDSELADGEYLEIRVTDTGTGMSRDVAARAFEPFFTLKEKGKGTGLGLSMVHGIVKQSGGVARIETELGRGTSIVMFLPRTSRSESEEEIHGAGTGDIPARGLGSILVIDDDADVRSFVTEVLKTAGHTVREAENGVQGIEAVKQELPDLVLVDFAMPGMNGAEVAQAIRELAPDQKLLFITGYSESAALEAAAPDAPVLRKPFRGDDLARCIDAILGATRQPAHSR